MRRVLHTKIQISALVPADREGAPICLCPVVAGWPSPAEDYIEDTLDLHKHVVRNEPATFFLHASGDSMIGAGIHDGDILVVDRSITAAPGKVVIAAVDGELTVKRLVRRGKRLLLMPENPDYTAIDITRHEDTCIWGVVTYVLHPL
ncbi:translesion error-prone DNA polymerase V autoproteolytic subunit [Desulfovibrio sp. OttesenSCG-928-F20]|nr:translesion error-prone DNA polymerase V autoproteolytic subunit [Desulfovibrio sp. OttesenSCG-928-M16]MDL2290861.1 translesion error-prone DNA polymerase V autoproteolytic subunit [Desulfovibrio sp. OttesenSCG-928-F20]